MTEGLRLANLLRFSLGPAALRPAGHGHAGTVTVAESDSESHTESVNVHRDRRTDRPSALRLQKPGFVTNHREKKDGSIGYSAGVLAHPS